MVHFPIEPLLQKDVLVRPVFDESIFVDDIRFYRAAKVIEDRLEMMRKNQRLKKLYHIFPRNFFLRCAANLASSLRVFPDWIMSKIEPQRVKVFIGVFTILAICINSVEFESLRQKHLVAVAAQTVQQNQQLAQQQAQLAAVQRAQQEAEQRQLEAQRVAAAQQAAADAATAHANFLARYLSPGFSRLQGAKTIATVASSENGAINQTVSIALAKHLKTVNTQTVSSFFTPTFVSDGLLTEAFNGSPDVFTKLEIAHSLDAVVLARQSVQYAKNPSLDNVITATMTLEVMLSPLAIGSQVQTWTLEAYGAGFDNNAARALAEERIVKQISKETNILFSVTQ